ncbi:MAG: helix-turn-helix transcriptional regulator [Dehalococcoidia bacterium]
MTESGQPRSLRELTPRQREVLELLRRGLTNEEIAGQLGISLDGAKWHVSEILSRLGVDNRQEAALWPQGGDRHWWSAAFAPLRVGREAVPGWGAKGGGGVVIGAAGVGVALLAWGIIAGGDDEPGASRTGVPAVDDTIQLLVRRDVDGLMGRVRLTTIGCSVEQTIGSPPPCQPGTPDGTPVEAFPVGYCEGTYLTDDDAVHSALGAALVRQPSAAIYAVLRGHGTGAPAGGYTVAVTPDMPSQPTAPVSFWYLEDDGAVTGLGNECGAAGAAQQIAYRFEQPDYLLGPFINCSPPPGEFANLLITVDGLSPGGIRPQFWGPAKSTLEIPTGERAIVTVTDNTDWGGDLARLEDVRTGIELQATGRRQDDCTILADTILSPGPNAYLDDALGIELSYPSNWRAGAAPMPYATCITCTVLGPADVRYPHGIQIFELALDAGCRTTFCWSANRALPLGEPEAQTVAERPAFRVEFERQAPLGLVAETGDDTPYREIMTQIHLAGRAIYIVGFYRQGESVDETYVRRAYDAVLSSLALTPP